jgi:predicted nucleic acid-binding protein
VIVALDSNVLLYAAGVRKVADDTAKTAEIRALIERIDIAATIVCPWQVFGECYRVMLRNGRTREECRLVIQQWQGKFDTVASSDSAFEAALDLATDHKLQFWDALILSITADAGCTLLLSEDMQSGFAWRGVTVVDPFVAKPHPKLARLLAG